MLKRILRDFTPSTRKKFRMNTQPLPSPEWVCGFVDGEGSFFISITHAEKLRLKKQVTLRFKVSQHEQDKALLYKLQAFFGVGKVYLDGPGRKVWVYVVASQHDIAKVIVPFFEKNALHTSKKFEFLRFRRATMLMDRKVHLAEDGLAELQKLRERMNQWDIPSDSTKDV